MAQTVLIVEDNELNRRLFTDVLRHAGFEVYQAADGREAIAAAQRLRPDVILMDMELPRLPGLEATRRIKADPGLAATPILAISAFAGAADAIAAREGGCDAYLPKPVRPDALVAAVTAALSGRRAADRE
ncbi:MAG: response regulator [Paracoccaceae bacterium]